MSILIPSINGSVGANYFQGACFQDVIFKHQNKNWWCPKYVDELFTNLDSAGLSQKDINTFMTLPKNF
ncbi:hypothetical protein, partial [Desulfamplus magnetovallimortis]|uniref:hypothetical protein n=1 Tax=Desulfamplus magnetovallimortis TaxID=1246637 RepID=UPI001C96304E